MADLSFQSTLFTSPHDGCANTDSSARSRFSFWQRPGGALDQSQSLPQEHLYSRQQEVGSSFFDTLISNGASLFSGHKGSFGLEQGGYFSTGNSPAGGMSPHGMGMLGFSGLHELTHGSSLEKDMGSVYGSGQSAEVRDTLNSEAAGAVVPAHQVVAQLLAETSLKEADMDHKHLSLCSGLTREVKCSLT